MNDLTRMIPSCIRLKSPSPALPRVDMQRAVWRISLNTSPASVPKERYESSTAAILRNACEVNCKSDTFSNSLPTSRAVWQSPSSRTCRFYNKVCRSCWERKPSACPSRISSAEGTVTINGSPSKRMNGLSMAIFRVRK